MIGDGYKTYKDSSLKAMNKDELISIIRMLESNLRNANEMNDRQFKMLSKYQELCDLDEIDEICEILMAVC